MLYGTFVRRQDGRLEVTAVWACDQNGDCPRRRAIAHSTDGFATADYSSGGGTRRLQAALAPARPAKAGRYASCAATAEGAQLCLGGPADGVMTVRWTRDGGASWQAHDFMERPNLIAAPITALRTGTLAVQWGGDGATLFPFERVSRSTDSGRTWSTVDVVRPDGVMPYTSGSVVLSDGRLVSLLDSWSDDGRGKPSDRPHGLYASNGSDWSSYRPMRSVFRPALHEAPKRQSPIDSLQASADPDPVIWVTTWDKLLYVSTDDGQSFRQVRAR